MIRVELNIGLKRNDTLPAVSPRNVKDAIIHNRQVSVPRFREAHSETEPTLVCRFVWISDQDHLRRFVNALALVFGQDCIAVYYPRDIRGELIGPKAAQWGEFNPEFFIRYREQKVLDAA